MKASEIRLSVGSAVMLGLHNARMIAPPTTLYTMLGESCLGRCRFCTQASNSNADHKFLSRVVWPKFDLDDVLNRLKAAETIKRFCFQTLLYPNLLEDLLPTVESIRKALSIPISVCMNPTQKQHLIDLKQAGVERVGVGLDCATPKTFAVMKPGFKWNNYMRFIDDIADVFGKGAVHLIVGLGDTDEALITMFQQLFDRHCYVALFAFTPVRGTNLDFSPPAIERYRALQLARHLIMHGQATAADMRFEDEKLVAIDVPSATLERALSTGQAFRPSGCPNCNRPMYNERPGGVMYNYPQALTQEEKDRARDILGRYLTF